MPRYIDADELLMCNSWDFYDENGNKNYACIAVENAPTVDVEPVKRGRWIKLEDDYNNHLYECSYCHTWTSLPTEEVNDGNIRYCWSCGAKMDRERKDK